MGVTALQLWHVTDMWRTLRRWPGGLWLFARFICVLAPYFSSIRPTITALHADGCSVMVRNRRRVRNHVGSFHGIALCNAAELAAGLLLQATVPRGCRWMPTGLSAEFLNTTDRDIIATATYKSPPKFGKAIEFPIHVDVTDAAGRIVAKVIVSVFVAST